MKKTIALTAIAAIAVFGLGFGVTAIALDDGNPAWVDSEGRVDPARMPAMVPVENSAGKVVGFVRSADLNAPPPPPTSTARASDGLTLYDSRGRAIGTVGENGVALNP
jgi:hypothetical protein